MGSQSQRSEISLLVAVYKWLALVVDCGYIGCRPPGIWLGAWGLGHGAYKFGMRNVENQRPNTEK